jgi:hypothetical protein
MGISDSISRMVSGLVVVLFGLLLIPISVSISPVLFEPDVDISSANSTSVTFRMDPRNSTDINSTLNVESDKLATKNYRPLFKDGKLIKKIEISGGRPKHYAYNWSVSNRSSTVYSSGTFTVPSGNETMRDYALRLTNNLSNQYPSYCNFNVSDFSCGNEEVQALKIHMNRMAYEATDNKTYLRRSINYSIASYANKGPQSTCDASQNDYNCEDGLSSTPIYSSSGERQGRLIRSLWALYASSSNSTVKSLARNYTTAKAENCPVWGSSTSYICGNPSAQGLMMSGYWKAYQVSGNISYKRKATKLSTTNYSTNSTAPALMRGLLAAYQATEKPKYLNHSRRIAKLRLQNLSNSTSEQYFEFGLGLTEGYEYTGNYGFYRNSIKLADYNISKLEFSCSPSNADFKCSTPKQQALAASMYLDIYMNRKDLDREISNPSFDIPPVAGEEVTFDVDMEGKIQHPRLVIESNTGNKIRCDISFIDGCRLDGDQISRQGVYKYFINSTRLRFPRNNSFRVAVTTPDAEKIRQASKFSGENVEDQAECPIWSNDFSCEDTYYQAAMISGISEALKNSNNNSYQSKLKNLVKPPYYKDLLKRGSTCEPRQDIYSCNSRNLGNNLQGSTRQGSIIRSLFKTYSVTDSRRAYDLAREYVSSNPSDCEVWNQDFVCGSPDGQASMILGYWTAHRITSNITYKRIATNLSRESLNMSISRKLGAAYWKTFSLTSNETYLQRARNITSKFTGECRKSDCSPQDYSRTGSLYRSAYLYGNNTYLETYRTLVLGTTTKNGCGPGKKDFSCDNPAYQGLMTDLFSSASKTIPLEFNATDSFSLNPKPLVPGQTTTAKCMVSNNLQDTLLENVSASLDLSEGLETSENTTKQIGNLTYNTSSAVSWNIEAREAGLQTATCRLLSDNGFTEVLQREIDVAEQTEGEDEPENSNPDAGSFSSQAETDSTQNTENQTYNYEENRKLFNLTINEMSRLGINTTLRNFSLAKKSCYTARRELSARPPTLKLNYTCSEDGLIVVDTLNNSNSSLLISEFEDPKEDISISYPVNSRKSAPMVISYQKLKPLNMDVDYYISTNKSSVVSADIELNRKERCNVRKGNVTVYNKTVKSSNVSLDLRENNTQILIKCGASKSSYTFVSETELQYEGVSPQSQDLPRLLLYLGLISSIISIILYRRSSIDARQIYRSIMFSFNLRRFRYYISKNRQPKAVNAFEALSKYSDVSESETELQTNIQLNRGVRIYIMLEIINEELGEDPSALSRTADDLNNLVRNYLQDEKNEKMCTLVKNKAENIGAIN